MDAMWLWGILGLVLLGLEMATGTLYILWFGIAGLLLALVVWLLPNTSAPAQVFLYSVLSFGSLLTWRYLDRANAHDLRVGQSKGEEIGRTGTITEKVSPKENGKIQFAQGVMGSREWIAIADEEIEVGRDARIIAVEGNALRVKPIKN
jgi:inner membrane protein